MVQPATLWGPAEAWQAATMLSRIFVAVTPIEGGECLAFVFDAYVGWLEM
jgi:hypothetical protein